MALEGTSRPDRYQAIMQTAFDRMNLTALQLEILLQIESSRDSFEYEGRDLEAARFLHEKGFVQYDGNRTFWK